MSDLGPWRSLSVSDTNARFRRASFRWWISGGHALELHLGRSWRAHDDTDVGVARRDLTELAGVLGGWDLHVAAAGELSLWDGEPLEVDRHQNNLWCRPTPSDPWALDVTIGEGDEDHWIYRRDPSVTARWADAVLHSADGVPYLAPELQLLFKSKDVRPKDDVDALQVVPDLSPARRSRLAGLLPDDHSWQRLC